MGLEAQGREEGSKSKALRPLIHMIMSHTHHPRRLPISILLYFMFLFMSIYAS
jgi:hypothetical protein